MCLVGRVQSRDSFWRNHYQLTDEANPQWKQVLDDCRVKVTYALSPQAKGKIERPYRWLQVRLVRTCYRENIRDIQEAQLILNDLVQKYNYQIVHSTTGEIPCIRFQRAIREKRSLFREFSIMPPFKSTKDIFCLRVDRMVDSYRKVCINNLEIDSHAFTDVVLTLTDCLSVPVYREFALIPAFTGGDSPLD